MNPLSFIHVVTVNVHSKIMGSRQGSNRSFNQTGCQLYRERSLGECSDVLCLISMARIKKAVTAE